jgi:hypothetical protein
VRSTGTTGVVHCNVDGGEEQFFRRNVIPVVERNNAINDELTAATAVEEC